MLQPGQTEVGFDDVQDQIVTVVRERALFASTSLLWKLDGTASPPRQQHEPISDWFAKALVIDSPTHMALVNEVQVQTWMQTPDELFAFGLEKLRSAKPPAFVEDNGVFKGTWNDDYDSSRILISGLFDDLPLRGHPVVTIPNRLTLLVAGSEDTAAIKRMLATAEDIVRNIAKPQNPAPLLVENGEVSDYTVETSSPIYNDVARAKRLTALIYYQDQKVQLEQLYEKSGKDIFVASYSLNQTESGDYRSHAVLSRGVSTLLPVVDDLILVASRRPEGTWTGELEAHIRDSSRPIFGH